MDNFFIRKAIKDDIKEVYNLSNDDYVRKYSINKSKIKWDDHVIWFNEAINKENIVFYIITNDAGQLLGQIRYKTEDDNATISISLSSLITGKGLSKIILRNSMDCLFIEKKRIRQVLAYISEENIPSIKMFERVGYIFHERDNGLLKYIYSRGVKD